MPSVATTAPATPMTNRVVDTASSAPRAARLSATAAFYLQASIIVFFLAGSSAPTPLYAMYQAAWGFSPITVTLVFGIYALAVLAMLLTVGSLSDFVGRRPILIAATLLQAAAMLVFATAGGVPALLAARILQGLSTGAAAGAVGAGMLDIDRAKGTIANAVGPMMGTAVGGIASGLMVQYLPAPTHLVYLVLFVIFMLQSFGVYLMAETSSVRPGALISLKPRFHLPAAARRPMLLAVPALVASWALAGLYGSLMPTLLRRVVGAHTLLGEHARLLGGLAIFVLAASGATFVLLLRARTARTLMSVGSALLFAGVGVTLLAITFGSTAAFFVGSAVAGMGFGGSFQGAIRSVLPLAAVHERAGVLSVLYVISYLAMGLPAVIAGFGVVYGGGLMPTAHVYGAVVMLLAGLALLGSARRARTSVTANRGVVGR
jgi:MFS family permease